MSRIVQSTEFIPSSGVSHTDNILEPNSPTVSGGVFQSPDPKQMSRNEFELRKSISFLNSQAA